MTATTLIHEWLCLFDVRLFVCTMVFFLNYAMLVNLICMMNKLRSKFICYSYVCDDVA
jgi:hypothetical protein